MPLSWCQLKWKCTILLLATGQLITEPLVKQWPGRSSAAFHLGLKIFCGHQAFQDTQHWFCWDFCYPVRDWFSVPRPEENIFIAMKISSWSCSFPPGSHTCTYQKVRGPGLRDAWSSVVCCLSYFLCLFFKCWQKRTHTRMLWKDADTKFGSRHLPTVM